MSAASIAEEPVKNIDGFSWPNQAQKSTANILATRSLTAVYNEPGWCDYPPYSENPETDFPDWFTVSYNGTLEEALGERRTTWLSFCALNNGHIYYNDYYIKHDIDDDGSDSSNHLPELPPILNESFNVIDDSPSRDVSSVIVTLDVIIPLLEPRAYVVDYFEMYDLVAGGACIDGYLNIKASDGSDNKCIKGSKVENIDGTSVYNDIVICDVLIPSSSVICESIRKVFEDLTFDDLQSLILHAVNYRKEQPSDYRPTTCRLETDPQHVGYPYSDAAEIFDTSGVPEAIQIAIDEGNHWLFVRLTGRKGEKIARDCLKSLGYEVWPGNPSLRVLMNYSERYDDDFVADYQIRFPDIAVKKAGV